MKILMLTNDYEPLIGGIAAHVRHLSKALSKAGHEAHVVVPTPEDPDHLVTERKDGLSVHRWGYRDSGNRFIRAYRIDAAAQKAVDAVRNTGAAFDIVHQQDVRATKHAASKIAGQYNVPLVWTYHSPQLWNDGDRWNHLFLKLIRFNPHGIITVSKELREQAVRNWGNQVDHIQFIPNGVDTGFFSPRNRPSEHELDIGPDDFVLFCPSRLVPKKGVAYLAEAIKNISREQPETRIKAIFFSESQRTRYDSGYYTGVRELLGDLVDSQALFTEYVSYSKMPRYYALSDLVVIPSLKEAVSLSMLEAMAMQKPVLASDVGGMAEVIEHGETGWLVPPADAEALGEAIRHLYGNPELRGQLAENGYRLAAEQYNWDRVAEQTIAFYEEVLSSEQ